METNIGISDLLPKDVNQRKRRSEGEEVQGKEQEEEKYDNKREQEVADEDEGYNNESNAPITEVEKEAKTGLARKWIASSFIKPLRLLDQLSGFNNLTALYKILVTLAVTSCQGWINPP